MIFCTDKELKPIQANFLCPRVDYGSLPCAIDDDNGNSAIAILIIQVNHSSFAEYSQLTYKHDYLMSKSSMRSDLDLDFVPYQ